MNRQPGLTTQLLIFFAGLVLFLPFLGKAHLFDWDEINFAECAREMLVTGDYSRVMINFESFWEKPPLFFWLQVISMKIFGINEFAARFPNALCGAITLVFLYRTGTRIHSEKFGLWWAFLYAATLLPHFYFRSGIIDPWFNLFIFASVTWFVFYLNRMGRRMAAGYLVLSALVLGLATLTKGPVALLVFAAVFVIFLVSSRFRINISFASLALFTILTLITAGFWFMIEIFRGNGAVVAEFINYQVRLLKTQDAGHGGPFIYHFLVLFFGCFPASALAIAGMRSLAGGENQYRVYRSWSVILFWVVLLLFSIVRTKIVHYSSLCYFPLTFLATGALLNMTDYVRNKKWVRTLFFVSGLVFATGLLILPLAGVNSSELATSKWIGDQFVRRALLADVSWSAVDFIPALLAWITLIYAVFFQFGRDVMKSILVTGIGNILILFIAMVSFVPRVERFSQGAAIDFYKSLQDKQGVIAEPYGFKSYAHLFYARRPPPAKDRYPESPLFYNDELYKVYAVTKIQDSLKAASELPGFVAMESRNGFVFWERK